MLDRLAGALVSPYSRCTYEGMRVKLMRMPTSQKWFTEGSSGKLPTSKNLIIETRNEKIYTKVKSRAKRVKMAFDSPRLNKVSDSASLISGSSSSGFQIQITVAISLITDQTTRPKAFSMFKMAAGITTHNWPQSWIALDNNLH